MNEALSQLIDEADDATSEITGPIKDHVENALGCETDEDAVANLALAAAEAATLAKTLKALAQREKKTC